jgi:large repetitive protein
MATTLAAGDIAIIGYDTDDSGSQDSFSFVLLQPITTGTTIFFTDRSWNGSSFSTSGTDGTFTYTAASNLAAGTVVNVTHAQVTGAGMNLDSAGETLYAYQGTINTPSTFLYALDFADGNTTFNGSLANTGLTNGVNAVAVAQDDAVYAGATNLPGTLLSAISNHNEWVGADNAGQTAVFQTPDSGPFQTANPEEIWIAGAGDGSPLIHVDVTGAGTAANETTIYENTNGNAVTSPSFVHPAGTALDTVQGLYFVADSNGTTDRILQGSLSSALNSPGTTPTLTTLWTEPVGSDPTNSRGVTDIRVDTIHQFVYFTDGTQLLRVNYSTPNQTATVIADLGTNTDANSGNFGQPNFANDFAINYTTGVAYIVSSQGFSAFGQNTLSGNTIWRVSGLNGSGTITELSFADSNPANASTGALANPHDFNFNNGQLYGIDIDPSTGLLYVSTTPVNTIASGFPYEDGGVFRLDPSNANNVTDVHLVDETSNTNPNGIFRYISVDPSTGLFYVSDNQFTSGSPQVDQSAIYSGSMSTVGGTLTLFASVANVNALAPQGLTIDHGPTLSVTSAASPSYTETAGSPSAAGTAVTLITADSANDIDTAAQTDQLASATVRISSGFLSGASHQDTLTFTNSGGITGSYDSTTGILTLSGPATFSAYQTVLQSVHFTDSGDNPTNYGTDQSRTIAWSVSDGLLSSAEQTTSIAVVGVDDPPVNNGVSSKSGNEDTLIPITGLSVSDVDADPANQDITVQFTVTHGTLTLNTSVAGGLTAGDITAGANNSSTFTVTATQNQINATLQNATGLQYQGDLNFNTTTGGSETLTITSNDQGFNGTGGPLGDSDNLSITVNPVNDSPVLSNVGPNVSVTEQTTATLDADVTVSDVDLDPLNGGAGSYTGASLTIARNGGANAQDTYSFDTTSGTPLFSVSGGNLQAGGLTFATFTSSGGTLTIDFTSSGTTATTALVNDAIDRIQYTNTSDDPPASIVLNYSFNDGSPGNSQGTGATGIATGSTTVNITPVNDPPTLSATGASATFTENGAGSDLYSSVSVSAVEAADNIQQLTLTVGGLADGANEILHVDGSDVALTNGTSVTTATNGLTASVSVTGSTATVTLSHAGGVAPATMASIVDGMTYADNGDTPTAGTRTITLTQIQDTGGTANGGNDTTNLNIAATVNVVPVNDAPVATMATDPYTATEQTSLDLKNSGMSVSDVDALGASETVTLSVGEGTLHVDAGTSGALVTNSDTSSVTITGTLAEINDLLNTNATSAVSYIDNSDNPSATTTLTLHIDDGGNTGSGGAQTGNDTSTINITAQNDAPVATITPTEYDGSPNASIDLKNNGLSVSDVDGNAGSETVTLSATSGTLTVTAGTSGAGVSNSGTSAVTITGTIAQINDLLNTNATSTVSYVDSTGGTRTLTLAINDNGNTGGGALTGQDTANIVLDNPPVVDLNGATAGTGATLNYTENDAATAIAPTGTTTDSDSPDFSGGSLTVHFSANGGAEDQLSILTDNTILLNGTTVQYDADGAGGNPAVDIGTVSGGTNGADLVVSFNTTDATPTSVSALIEHIGYADNSDNPSTAARSVLFTVNDGDGASGSDTATINITAVNDAPVVGGTTGVNTSYTEQAAAVVVDSGVTVSDVDSANLAGATVSITGGFSSGDTLHFTNTATITGSYDSTTHVLTLSGSDTVANYQTALRSVTFDNLSNDDPTRTSATRTITWQVDDGSASSHLSNTPTSTITITPVNDAPIVSNINTTDDYTENGTPVTLTPSNFPNPPPPSGVLVTDPDPTPENAPGGNGLLLGATVTITDFQPGDELVVFDTSLPAGPGNPSTSGFYTGVNIAWNYDSSTGILTLTSADNPPTGDTIIDYEHVLSQVQFVSTSDDPTNGGANPTRTITWQVQDAGGTANGGSDTSVIGPSTTTTLTIHPLNDAPVNTVPAAQTVNEDTSLVFSSANSNAISTSDVDNASGNEQVQLSVGHGTLTLSQTTGLAFNAGANGTGTMTFTGTVADVNSALNGLTYLGNANYNGPDTLTIHTDDQGNTGTPGALTDQDSVAITVNSVNDSPALTGVGDPGDTPSFIENGSPVVLDTDNNASVSDVELDASANNYAGATLTLARSGGANPDDVFGSVGSLDLTDVGTDGNVSLDGGATFIGTFTQPGDGSISFTFNANATAADVDSVMRQITYQDTSDNPPASAQIDFTFSDGNGQPGGQAQGSGATPGVATGSITVQITQVDDPPVLSNVATSAAYSPGSPGALLSTANVITDPDATPPSPITGIHSATVQIASGFFAGDELFVNLQSSGGHFLTADSDPTNISAVYAAGTLTLSGQDSISHYQQILDAVAYRSTAADPTNGGADPNRTITWQVNDGALNSQTPSPGVDDTIPPVNETVLHFDVAPVVDLDGSTPGTGYTTTYTTGNAPIAIVNNDSVTDPDTANADSMTIVLTNARAGDALSVAGSLPGGITSSVDTSVPGQITLRLTNSASMADYQTALAQVRYVNSNVSPNTTDRDITVVLSESGGVNSNTAHATVHVVDATPPAKPPAPDLTDATDSGVSHTDNITNVTAPTFTGNVEPGTTVRLYDSNGTTVIGTGAADAQTGAYTITSSSLSQGTHHLTVTATDASNNTSVHSDALDVTIDTTPPAPTLTAADPTTTFRNSIVHYTLSYPETTFGVDASDFTLTMSGGATGAAITGVSEPGGPGTPYTISVSTGTGFGSIEVDLRSSGTGITDTAGNPSGGATGPVYSIVNRPPVARNDVATLPGAQTTILGNVVSNDSDADGDALRVTSIADYLNGTLQQVAVPASGNVTLQSTHGSFTVSADGSYSFTANDARPVQNHYAIDPLLYVISDGNGGTAGANLEVHLSGQQRPSTETFNFNFVQSTVSYGSDGEAYLTGPDGVTHNVTGVGLLIFNDGRINEADYNQSFGNGGPPPGLAGSPLVDDLYYDSQYHDVYLAGIDPEAHYAANGWHEGRNPDPYFNTNYYLSNNPDVAAAHINPLDHYDANGWREGRNPGPNFNTVDYELANPDVAAAHVDPLAQYLSAGELENRVIFPANAGTDGPVNGFDPAYYLANNPDVAAAHVNPLQHYLVYGWHEGRNPSADFNTNYYESHNPDVAAAGIDPLLHYDQYGWHEGRDPAAVFSTNGYLTTYTDVAAAGINPLQHFLQYGMAEGRSPTG